MNDTVPEKITQEDITQVFETLADATNGVIHVPFAVWREHQQRVETLCNLLEQLGEAIANSPYAAMLPADLMQGLQGK